MQEFSILIVNIDVIKDAFYRHSGFQPMREEELTICTARKETF